MPSVTTRVTEPGAGLDVHAFPLLSLTCTDPGFAQVPVSTAQTAFLPAATSSRVSGRGVLVADAGLALAEGVAVAVAVTEGVGVGVPASRDVGHSAQPTRTRSRTNSTTSPMIGQARRRSMALSIHDTAFPTKPTGRITTLGYHAQAGM